MEDRFYPIDDPSTLIVVRQQSQTLLHDPAWEAQKTKQWQALQARRLITENAALLHVSRVEGDAVMVEPSITYRDIVSLRAEDTVTSAPYRALSALAVIESSDGQWLLFERDSGDWPHSFECPGGFVRAATPPATVKDFITTRLAREIAALSLQEPQCLGYYDLPSILEHMYVYRVRVKETAAQAAAQYGSAILALSPTAIPAYISGTAPSRLPLHAPSHQVLATVWATRAKDAVADVGEESTLTA